MKGLILSGGFGTRLRPLTYSQQKQLIPVANKPILFYGIEDLIKAGINDIGIIVGPNKDQVIDTVNGKNWEANIEFIEQDAPPGIAHTIKISKDFIGDNCEINGSEIEDSVILDEVKIKNGGRIIDSLIGRNAKIFKNNHLPKGRSFVIGDNSEVIL